MPDSAIDLYRLDPGHFRLALGAALRERRTELGMSQSALADSLEIRPSRIWEWENGRHVLRWDRLFLVCGALRITPTEMIARAETRTRDAMRRSGEDESRP
jgi:transcriptional regulator with XRE-family HTH domain